MRIYDPRLGRFLSVDPLTKEYPWYTPYQFAGNMPINSIDLDGLEPVEVAKGWVNQGPAAEGAKIGVGAAEKFLKGAVKTAIMTLGAFTELAANAHYGDKVENKEEAFPITHGNPVILVKQAILGPAELINQLKKDPTNPELWGEAAASLGILKFNFKTKARAADISLGLNEPTAYGPPRSLPRFAESTNSYMHYGWPDAFGSIGSPKLRDVSFGDLFIRVMDYVTGNKGTVKFDLTNLKMEIVAKDFGKSAVDAAYMTSFELNTIMNNPKYLKAVEFFENGKSKKTADVVKEYNEAINKQKKPN